MTPDDVKAHGTATFHAPRTEVLHACADTLKAMGYTVVREDLDGGLVVTEQVNARTPAFAPGRASYLRRYEIAVRETPDHTVEVVATPMLSDARVVSGILIKSEEASPKTAWKLEEERAEWKRLFDSLEVRLAHEGERPGA